MEKNKIKKIMGAVGIGLAVVLTTAVGIKAVESMNGGSDSGIEIVGGLGSESDFANFGKYQEYGRLIDGSKPTKELINQWIKDGFVSKEQGELDLKFLEAQTEDEKEKIYDQIIDVIKGPYELTEEEANKLKEAGYKKYERTLNEIYIQDIVDAGGMTAEDAKIEILYDSAVTKEEKDEVVGLLVDRMLKDGDITEAQGEKIKADGYDKYYENLWEIENAAMVDELLKAGKITEDQAKVYRTTEDLDKLDELYEAFDKYELQKEVKEGIITQEEADLYMRYYDAETSEEADKIYGEILDFNVKSGIMTQEEANETKAYYGIK